MELAALIAKLEEASEGSRELDAEIFCAVNAVAFVHSTTAMIPGNTFIYRGADGQRRAASDHPRYTTSLDAALSLRPEGWTDGSIEFCFAAFASKPAPKKCLAWLANGDLNNPRTRQVTGESNLPAIAVAIAALKARQALTPTGDA